MKTRRSNTVATSQIQSTHLSQAELKKRLNAIVEKMRRTLDLAHWNNSEDFEDKFLHETWQYSADLRQLEADVKLTRQIDWYVQSKRRKSRA